MKKIFALLMLFSLCAITTGCPSSDKPKTPAPNTGDKMAPATPDKAPAPPVTPDKSGS